MPLYKCVLPDVSESPDGSTIEMSVTVPNERLMYYDSIKRTIYIDLNKLTITDIGL